MLEAQYGEHEGGHEQRSPEGYFPTVGRVHGAHQNAGRRPAQCGADHQCNALVVFCRRAHQAIAAGATTASLSLQGSSPVMMPGYSSTPCCNCFSRRRKPDLPGRRTPSKTPPGGGVRQGPAVHFLFLLEESPPPRNPG